MSEAMARAERTLYPSRCGMDETRLLAFARQACALLAPGFDPPSALWSESKKSIPYDTNTHVLRLGSEGEGQQ